MGVMLMLLSDHSKLVDSWRDIPSKLSDPRVQLDAINMEIAVKQAMAEKIMGEVAALIQRRRELIREILK